MCLSNKMIYLKGKIKYSHFKAKGFCVVKNYFFNIVNFTKIFFQTLTALKHPCSVNPTDLLGPYSRISITIECLNN